MKIKNFKILLLILFVILAILLTFSTSPIELSPKSRDAQLSSQSAWTTDGIIVSAASNNQEYPQICSDGTGGVIIVWQDYRSGSNWDIYAQRIDSAGVVQWFSDGIAICTAINNQGTVQICSDGIGGAIITWNDYRSGSNWDIYTQRINSTGDVQWTSNGTVICTASNDQEIPKICSDGAGGAIITWNDYNRNGPNWDIYAQRVNSTGDVKWMANGTAICTANKDQLYPQICSYGTGEAIITWEDSRSGLSDIYAQRVDSNGNVNWTTNGVAICTENNTQWYPKICSDETGGVIITWSDYRSGSNYDIYAQKVNSTGDVKWIANGIALCTVDRDQEDPQILSDGTGGAIIIWEDNRTGSNSDIFSQRVDSIGDVKWVANGTAVCIANNNQNFPQICSDGAGGAIITWQDSRSGLSDIYAQRVDSFGNINWTTNGVAICTATNNQWFPQISSDENGGAIITWFDRRSGLDYDIYAQLIKNPPINGGKAGGEAFPFGNLIAIVLFVGGITIGGITTVFLIIRRRKHKK